MAARLHAEQPDVYKDANHKPEMAIALTDFEALLGFRPLHQILAFIQGECSKMGRFWITLSPHVTS